jgi:hypothetical protein
MAEQWRPVVGFEKIYRVSDAGRVMHQATQRILKAGGISRYRAVGLYRFAGDKMVRREIHRLVAEAFMGPHPGMVVHHKNSDRHDNRLENLEWCTQAQNLAYSRAEGKQHRERVNGRFVARLVHGKNQPLESAALEGNSKSVSTTSGR